MFSSISHIVSDKENRWIIFLTLITLGTRIFNIEASGLWTDELFTAVFASPDRSLSQVINGALSTPIPSPPIIFLVAHSWMKVFGFNDAALRIPFAIIGSMAIPAIYLVGKTLFNRTVGLLSAILLMFSSYHLFYTREARYYGFIAFFSLMTIYFLYKGIHSNHWKYWAGYVFFALLCAYTHFITLFVLAGQGIYVIGLAITKSLNNITDQKKYFPFLSFIIAALIILILYSPMISFIEQGYRGPRGATLDLSYEGNSKFNLNFFINELFGTFGGKSGIPLIIFNLFAFLGFSINFRKSFPKLSLFIIISSVPFIVIPLFKNRHWFHIRYVIYILPLYLIVVSLGIINFSEIISKVISSRAKNSCRQTKTIFTLVIVGFILILNFPYYLEGYKPDPRSWREQLMFVNEVLGSDDIFLTADKTPLLNFHPKKIMRLYFEPISKYQRGIRKIKGIKELKMYYSRREFVIFHYMIRIQNDDSIQEILSWVGTIPHIKMRFNDNIIIYAGKNKNSTLLFNNTQLYARYMVP